MTGWALGVDFGTSNTAAAVRDASGTIRPIRLSSQADQMPSAVFVDGARIVVGVEAVRRARLHPAHFEPNPKKRLDEGIILLGDDDVDVSTLVGAVLAYVRRVAEQQAGPGDLDRVVLSHPQRWAQARRERLEEAARAARLPVVTLVSEPVAAATWYAHGSNLEQGVHVGVFDFGGGTCDVAVLVATGSPHRPFTVVATDGHEELGGEQLDDAIVDWILGQLRAAGHDELAHRLSDDADVAAQFTLRERARAAKHALSDYQQAAIEVAAGELRTVVTLTVTELNHMIAPHIDAAMALMERVLTRAGVEPATLGAMYLTGGSSHLRLVHSRLRDLLGHPAATMYDPKLVVAEGALRRTRADRISSLVPPSDQVRHPGRSSLEEIRHSLPYLNPEQRVQMLEQERADRDRPEVRQTITASLSATDTVVDDGTAHGQDRRADQPARRGGVLDRLGGRRSVAVQLRIAAVVCVAGMLLLSLRGGTGPSYALLIVLATALGITSMFID